MHKFCVPKHLTTSRSELASRVRLTLDRADYPVFHGLTVTEDEGTIVLDGRLPSYYLKQVAQTVAASVNGVRRVVNHVQVERPSN